MAFFLSSSADPASLQNVGFRWQYEDGEGVFHVLPVFPFHHVGGYDFDCILEGAEVLVNFFEMVAILLASSFLPRVPGWQFDALNLLFAALLLSTYFYLVMISVFLVFIFMGVMAIFNTFNDVVNFS